MAEYEGRLELTWTNKGLRLLAHEDGTYEWVPTTDYRVAEVRLLHDVATVGDCRAAADRAADNLLIRGDALHGLTSLIELPEFAKHYVGKVRLCYIDPPFNTGQAFAQYDDALEHSVWLTMLRDRLLQIKELLAADGSVWVHLDDAEVHRARCVLDEVFGADRFVATVIWQKRTTRENRAAFSPAHDFLLVYAPLGAAAWRNHRNSLGRPEATPRNLDDDPRGPWTSVPFTAQGFRKNQMYEIVTPAGNVVLPPDGRCWGAVRTEFDKFLADNRIYFPKGGTSRPRVKQFVEDEKGLVPLTIWPSAEAGENDQAKKHIMAMFPGVEAFATPKPERLIERVVHIATNPGDVVLDCFLGSGTTAAVAHKMGRQWVGVEYSADTMATFALPRLTRVVRNEEPGGITDAVGWEGGGGFRVLDVAPSMFEEDEGLVVLSDWAANGALGEATAAQLGYDYESDPPFVGRKGRTRLAVIDGLVNEPVVRLLANSLSTDEKLVACGTAIDPAARQVLKDLRPGSTLRKIPASLLDEYRVSRRRSRLVEVIDWTAGIEQADQVAQEVV